MARLIVPDVDVACECGVEKSFPTLGAARAWARTHFDTCPGLGGMWAATATIALQPNKKIQRRVP
jgi:hypothetical protein